MPYQVVPLILLAYIIGSIPWAVWISRGVYGVDVRTQGSKNAGATNTFRVLGKRAGVAVLLLDLLKGIGSVMLASAVRHLFDDHDYYKLFQLSLALAATIGHIFPLFAKFKGGKGVATLTGAVFYVFPEAALVALGIFALVFLASKFISLSSMSASIAFACAVTIIYHYDYVPLLILVWAVPLLVLYTHRSNIQRLRQGTENKFRVNSEQ